MGRSDSRPSLPSPFVAFARRLPPRAPVFVAPRKPDAGLGPGVFGSGHPQNLSLSRRRRSGVPSSWGTPLSVCPVQSTPAGLRAPDRYSAAAWPLVCEKQRLPRKVFRRSIAGRSDSLSTLRRLGYPSRRKTRFQPLVRRYWTGFDPQGSYERFPRCNRYIPSSFPKLCLAQSHRPRRFWAATGCRGRGRQHARSLPLAAIQFSTSRAKAPRQRCSSR
jgi:hypothetical protein